MQTYQPVTAQPLAPISHLEEAYSRRAGRPLVQIGYETLGVPAAVAVVQNGALQDSYILGPGDELIFDLRGQENASYRQHVDKSGLIVLPKLNPIPATGRTLAEFRQALAAEVGRAYVSTSAYVSLGEVHQVSVLVTGYVRTPGMRIVSALTSPIDALLLSGGITKAGSLRNVELIRNGVAHKIDLYSILLGGGSGHLGMLQEGDRIYVAPLGTTVAIAGNVGRPGIYELPAGLSAMPAQALVTLAGGVLIANSYDISKTMLDRDGTTRLVPVQRNDMVRSGEIVFVDPSRTANLDRVSIMGAVQEPGTRPLPVVRSTGGLFRSVNDLLPEAYTPFGLIERHDLRTNALQLLPFSLIRALDHQTPLALQSNDMVYVFTLEEVRALARIATANTNTPYSAASQPATERNPASPNTASPNIGSPNTGSPNTGSPNTGSPDTMLPNTAPKPSSMTLGSNTSASASDVGLAASDPRLRAAAQSSSPESDALAAAQALSRLDTGAGTAAPTAMTDDQIADRIADKLRVPRMMLENAVRDQLVWVLDEVRLPGVYAAGPGTTVPEIIQAAGGVLSQADLSSVEVTSTQIDRQNGASRTTRNSYTMADAGFQSVVLNPFDVVRLRQVYSDRSGGTIAVAGEVRYPGIFDVTREERLSSVLQRAGGVTEVAYPYGAIFTRRSAAVHEKEGNARSARELEQQLAFLAAKPSQGNNQASDLQFLTGLAQEIRDTPALGRVVVTADPVVLASRPDLDVILEPGDALYIPKRPSSVAVAGEVLSPGSFQFRANLNIEDYIRMAGGPTQTADDDKTFIVLPDGSAMPTEQSWLTFRDGGHIPPGSTIVVPRDLRPFDWSIFLKDATQIVSQLAIAAASLAVLQNNN
ncbi:MAG: SLBB domain-containing protein [Rhizomicrobium sp.]